MSVAANDTLCVKRNDYIAIVSLCNVGTVLLGQPVLATLLWISFTAKRTVDVLNFNLALFHSFQYFLTTLHVVFMFFLPGTEAKILKFLFVYMQVGGPMCLALISMERYVAVIHPTAYPLLKKHQCREKCAAAMWLFSVSSAVVGVFTARCLSHALFQTWKVLPLAVMLAMSAGMVVTSVAIVKALKQSSPGRDKLHPVKVRAFRTVRITLILVVSFYIPVAVLQKVLNNNDKHKCHIIPVCLVLMSIASFVHPIFYLSTQKKRIPWIPCFRQQSKTG